MKMMTPQQRAIHRRANKNLSALKKKGTLSPSERGQHDRLSKIAKGVQSESMDMKTLLAKKASIKGNSPAAQGQRAAIDDDIQRLKDKHKHEMKTFWDFTDELNELSTNTLGSYAKKAHNRADIAARMSKSEYGDKGKVHKDMDRIANKRAAGAALAVTKLGRRLKKPADKADASKVSKLIKVGTNQSKDWKSPNKATNDAANQKYKNAQKGIGRVWDKAAKTRG